MGDFATDAETNISTVFEQIAADVRRIATEVTASEQVLALVEQVARLADVLDSSERLKAGLPPRAKSPHPLAERD